MAFLHFDFLSASTTRIVHLNVILPCDSPYGQNFVPPYKSLYLLTGFADNSDRVMLDSNLKKYSETTGTAIFVLDGNNSFYVDANPMSKYSTLVGQEMVEMTRKAFHLSDKREDTWLGGMSMGGFGAFYNGMKYADTFSKIILLAPAFDVYDMKVSDTDIPLFPEEFLMPLFGNREKYEAEFNFSAVYEKALESGKSLPDLFLGLGNTDDIVNKGVKHFREYMNEKNVPIDYHEVPGSHDFVFMDNIYPFAFDFLKQ